MEETITPHDKKILHESLRSFHNQLIETVLSKWQSRAAAAEEVDVQSTMGELKMRWEQKLEARVGQLSEPQYVEPLSDSSGASDVLVMQLPKQLPDFSSNENKYFSPLLSVGSSINASATTLWKPKEKINLQPFPKPQHSSTLNHKKSSKSSIERLGNSNVTKSASSPRPTPKRRRLVYHPEKNLSISSHEATNPLVVKIEANLSGTVLLQGMKIFVHIPSIQKVITSNSSSFSKFPEISSARIVHITRENIQTSTKIVSRTKLLLRLKDSGEEVLLPWPSFALHTNKSQLEANILALSKEDVKTANVDNDNRENHISMEETIASPNARMLPSYGQSWINSELDVPLHHFASTGNDDNASMDKITGSEGISFAEQLLAEVGDLSWCDIPAFGEDDGANGEGNDEGQRLHSGANFEKSNSSGVNDLQKSSDTTKALLVSGEVVDQTILEDIERYFELRRKHKPIFQVQSSAPVVSSMNDSQHLANGEDISSIPLHPEDDPLSAAPTPDIIIIGKAAKVVAGDSELYLVLKDAYVRCEDDSLQDMILPHISIRLASSHLFGK